MRTGRKIKRFLPGVIAAVGFYLVAGFVLDDVVFPESTPGPEYFAPEGHRFASRLEGFRQFVIKREGGLAWVELTLEPHAAGPPEHVHTTFPEKFVVAHGTLSLMVNGETVRLGPGESLFVPPGTPHRPFNETNESVVVRGPLTPEYAIPDEFTVFLTQAYAYFDEAERNAMPPRVLLQMSRFSPRYDSWLAGSPILLQKALFFAIRPTARLLGYRAFYDKYRPGSQR